MVLRINIKKHEDIFVVYSDVTIICSVIFTYLLQKEFMYKFASCFIELLCPLQWRHYMMGDI